MATPWQQVLTQVNSINDPQSPFSYTVEGERIVGYWDVAKIETLGFGGASTFDRDYRIDINPVEDGRFDYTEHGQRKSAETGLDGAHFEIGGFKGKSKSFSFGTKEDVISSS